MTPVQFRKKEQEKMKKEIELSFLKGEEFKKDDLYKNNLKMQDGI
jgi:hypothetical protein